MTKFNRDEVADFGRKVLEKNGILIMWNTSKTFNVFRETTYGVFENTDCFTNFNVEGSTGAIYAAADWYDDNMYEQGE